MLSTLPVPVRGVPGPGCSGRDGSNVPEREPALWFSIWWAALEQPHDGRAEDDVGRGRLASETAFMGEA